jgi:hypothetical protein
MLMVAFRMDAERRCSAAAGAVISKPPMLMARAKKGVSPRMDAIRRLYDSGDFLPTDRRNALPSRTTHTTIY